MESYRHSTRRNIIGLIFERTEDRQSIEREIDFRRANNNSIGIQTIDFVIERLMDEI